MQINRNAPTTSGEADGGIDAETSSAAGSKLLAIGVKPASEDVEVSLPVKIVVAGAGATGGGDGAGEGPAVGGCVSWINELLVVSLLPPPPLQAAIVSASTRIALTRLLEVFVEKRRSVSAPSELLVP